ncbi:MAG: hypothetical protein A2076_06285 [Geobacteraceae bacterium GWC2_53_11]|nr:MAG: hypothetical protein A2076_06285 [Geobacteraceae bacterium GWC2_53_11]
MKTHCSTVLKKRFFTAKTLSTQRNQKAENRPVIFLRDLRVFAVKMTFAVLLLCIALVTFESAWAVQLEHRADTPDNCRKQGGNKDCSVGPGWCKNEKEICSPELRGRCGKRKGDWYGARQPVTTAAEAQTLLHNYYAGQGYTVSAVSEKKWGFRADILDKNGLVVDRAMIDKRSGRIRSVD